MDVAIERILWVNTFGSFDNKDVLYVNALQDIAAKYAKTRSAAEAWFLLADRESQKADSYKPTGDSLNRYGYIKQNNYPRTVQGNAGSLFGQR